MIKVSASKTLPFHAMISLLVKDESLVSIWSKIKRFSHGTSKRESRKFSDFGIVLKGMSKKAICLRGLEAAWPNGWNVYDRLREKLHCRNYFLGNNSFIVFHTYISIPLRNHWYVHLGANGRWEILLLTGRRPTYSSRTSLLSPNLNCTHYDVVAV